MQRQSTPETQKLIEQARQLGGHKTGQETIDAALKEYIRRREQMELLNLFDTIEYDEDYDYKAQRNRA